MVCTPGSYREVSSSILDMEVGYSDPGFLCSFRQMPDSFFTRNFQFSICTDPAICLTYATEVVLKGTKILLVICTMRLCLGRTAAANGLIFRPPDDT